MEQYKAFGEALWVCAGDYASCDPQRPDKNGIPHFPILRRTFSVKNVKKAVLRAIGLGFFHCYLNGKEITDDQFMPLNSDYEERWDYPIEEKLTGHRIYVPEFDVTDLLKDGENVLALHFGGGWYTFCEGAFGAAKAIYRLTVETEDGTEEFVSSEADKIADSYVKTCYLTRFESQDYTAFDDAMLGCGCDDSTWAHAVKAKQIDTEYCFTDCPFDKTEKVFVPVLTNEDGDVRCYDAGQNLSGYPVLRIHAPKGTSVTVEFAEEKNEDGTPDMNFNHWQHFTVVSDGTERLVQPMFTWFGFRYFKVTGNAEVLSVGFVHAGVRVTSSFDSDNEALNWMYRAYLNTQLCNMHAGIPSDCPHLERRGYTGDGQLTCHAVMDMMDAKAFYRKWIDDISDCQDVYSGHIQYTAPYMRSGGGPGGWGCAIIEVPYMYYKHYGDKEPLERLYPQMLRYFDYLESHSVDTLVASDKANEWCLGDWCAPIQVILPAAYVNNYFYIKSLERMKEIAALVGRTCDIPMFEERIKARKDAVTAAYFNTWDGNFIGCLQGANAFAVDIGVGNTNTYKKLVEYYKDLGRYDTGIFGTDIVTRVLFEHGDGQTAADLMMSKDPISFDGMRAAGSTTLWENWPHATWDRSRNHPMFGAVAAYLFDYLLGIRQEEGKAGYDDIIIAPVLVGGFNRASGYRELPKGKVSVAYEKKDGNAVFHVTIPAEIKAEFRYKDMQFALKAGENTFTAAI